MMSRLRNGNSRHGPHISNCVANYEIVRQSKARSPSDLEPDPDRGIAYTHRRRAVANVSEALKGTYKPSGQLTGAGAACASLNAENARALWDTAHRLLEEPTP